MKSSKLGLGTVLAMAGLWSLIMLTPWTAQAQTVKIKEEVPSPAAPAAETQEPEERVVLHMVHDGEELHMLAGYYYGDCRQWPKIYQANRDQIKNPNKIDKRMILSIPVSNDWQPYMAYDIFFQKAIAGGPEWRAAAPPVTEEMKPEEMKPEEKKTPAEKPEGKKPEEKKAPEEKS